MKSPDIRPLAGKSNPLRRLRTLGRLLLLLMMPAATAAEIFVSAGAGPAGNGSATHPFQTIDEARLAARQVRNEAVTITIAGGRYIMRKGMVLSAFDSGSADRRITYRSAPGEEARISTGIVVSLDKLAPVSDERVRARLPEEARDRVRQVRLDDLGMDIRPFADNFRGLELLEVYWNGKRLPLARWPGGGKFSLIEKVVDNGIKPPSTGIFVYRGDEPSRWKEAMEDGLWLRGFWRVPWVIEAVRVASIDTEARTMTLAVPVAGGIGSKYHRGKNGVGEGSGKEPWEAINLIEAISAPGAWAVRFADRTLYLIPPEGDGELLITDVREPVIKLSDGSHITLERLSVEGGLSDGIRVEGGEEVLIAGCKVSNVAQTGIIIHGGKNHTVLSCDTSQTGLSGIGFLGGNRIALTPGGHRIMNNNISNAGLYFPAPGIDGGLGIKTDSVGNYVAYNRIHDSSNSGIVYSGNENTFEYNDIYRVGLGSSDLGCFYTTGGWTSRGNVVRYNLVHHSMNANAFYVDDGDCGDQFFGNIAYNTASGGFIGGGHDQVFRNNIMVGCTRAMHVDARGIARGYTAGDKRLRDDLDSVPYQLPPWSEKYPGLVKILESHPERPEGIVIEDNLFVCCQTAIRRSNSDSDLAGVVEKNNVVSDSLSIFVNPDELDFTLKPDAPVFSEIPGFQQIPLARIGLYADFYRPAVPPRDMELLRTGSTERGFDSQTDIDASNRIQSQQP